MAIAPGMSDKSSPGAPLRAVLGFTAGYVAVAVAGALLTGNQEFVIYVAVLLVLMPCLLAVHRRYPLPSELLWAFSLWGLLHMAGGLLPIPESWFREGGHAVLYNWWILPKVLKFDQFVHAYGFGITTLLCWHLIACALRSADGTPVRPTVGMLALCVAAGMGFGALNEVVEFAATRVLPETNVGDYENTAWDLVFNLLGSLCAAAWIVRQSRSAASESHYPRTP
ncbi:MAG: DUF2238 domain-containing protein [Verrucomicrobiales bacterium]|nr:DUF2238 domain-containing protein [Verrucomicrobiales bacterium]